MYFNGTLVVTDPCYFFHKADGAYVKNNMEDWKKSEYGFHLERLGIEKFLTADTIYGDWSCQFFERETMEPTDYYFAADAGLVCATTMEEIKKYNPEFEEYAKDAWFITVIPNFKGEAFLPKIEDGDNEPIRLVELHGSHGLTSRQVGF